MKFVSLIALAALAVLAQTRFDMKVREDFFAGYAGDEERLARGMAVCETALKANPKDAATLVWHGGGLLYESGQLFRSGEAAKAIEMNQRAMREMNEAVELAPESLETRIPRGAILISTARFIDDPERARPYLTTGTSDYEKVLKLEEPAWSKGSVHSRGELLGGLADGYRRLGEKDKSRALLERIVTELPGTVYEKQAKRWLANFDGIGKQERFCLGCHASK